MLAAPDQQLHYGVEVSIIELAHWQASIAESTLQHPGELLPLLDDALVLAQEQVLLEAKEDSDAAGWTVKARALAPCRTILHSTA